MTQTQTQQKIKNVFITFDLFCFGNFQNKTLISLNENGIHLHISNELSIPNYNIQNFKEWKCWPQSQTLTNVILAVVQEGVRMRIHTTTQSDTCLKVPVKYRRFCFYIFLQVDLMLGGQMYFHKISRSRGTWYSPPDTFRPRVRVGVRCLLIPDPGRVLSYPPSDYK